MIKNTINNIEFDIWQIMRSIPQYMIGKSKADFATVFIFNFVQENNLYAVYAAFDTENDCSALVVVDENSPQNTIVNKIKGGAND